MAGDVDAQDELPELFYKCCKKVQCKTVICINCGQPYHTSCAERYKLEAVDSTRVKCCNKRNITSKGNEPNNLERENKILQELVNEMREKNTLLQEKVVKLEEELKHAHNRELTNPFKSDQPATFAEVTKQKAEKITVNNLPCIILKPKTEQDSKKTKDDFQSTVRPAKIAAGISYIKNSKNGSILIKCETEKAKENMKQEIELKMGSRYEIEETKMKKPTVKVVNIDWQTEDGSEDEDVIEAIYKQNEQLMKEEDHIKVKFFKKEKQFIILECNGQAYKKLVLMKKINVGYKKCPVYDNLHILRCYKCNGFNHTSVNCRNQETCSKCSQTHKSKYCNIENYSCSNCSNHNEHFKTKYDTNHDAYNTTCSVLKKKLQLLKEQIDYS